VHLLFIAPPVSVVLHCLAGGLLAACVGFAGWAVRALTFSGVLATIVVGALAYGFGGLPVAAALVAFFASGSILSAITARRMKSAHAPGNASSRRNAAQVFANGGLATLLALASATVHDAGSAALLLFGAVAAVAGAAGDTWSTELGTLFGGAPRSIASGQPVQQGMSGGITPAGIIAAPLGGALVGLSAWIFARETSLAWWLGIGGCSGLIASLADSWLGATVQAVWRCPRCQQLRERRLDDCATQGELVRGWRWLDNDGVNAAATLAGALCGFGLGVIAPRR